MDSQFNRRLLDLERELRGIRVGLKDFERLGLDIKALQADFRKIASRMLDLTQRLEDLKEGDEVRDQRTDDILSNVEAYFGGEKDELEAKVEEASARLAEANEQLEEANRMLSHADKMESDIKDLAKNSFKSDNGTKLEKLFSLHRELQTSDARQIVEFFIDECGGKVPDHSDEASNDDIEIGGLAGLELGDEGSSLAADSDILS